MRKRVIGISLVSSVIAAYGIAACSGTWQVAEPQENAKVEVGNYPLSVAGNGVADQDIYLKVVRVSDDAELSAKSSSTDEHGMFTDMFPRMSPWPVCAAEIQVICDDNGWAFHSISFVP